MKIVRHMELEWTRSTGYSKKVLLRGEEIKLKGAIIQLAEVDPGEKEKPHYHKVTTEILYVIEGGGYISTGDGTPKIEAGDLILLEPGDVHSVVNDSDKTLLILVFKINATEGDKYWI
ncbi:MAG: cupin domain-containing protein [Candidatus Bathyarchaeia archaeon]